MADVDWYGWHTTYDDPGSEPARRLDTVRRRLAEWLDHAPRPNGRRLRALSMCAGQGRDVIEVLRTHPRGREVQALLVELDARNVAQARSAAVTAGLSDVDVRQGDASQAAAYSDVVPVDLAVVCGVLGALSDADVARVVAAMPTLVAPGGTVVWTRNSVAPDLTPSIRGWFAEAGFRERSFDTEDGYRYSVGVHVLDGPAGEYDPSLHLFDFPGIRSPEKAARPATD